jgi:hypothetical protein
MAAIQIAKLASRCKAHLKLKADPTLCSVAVYRGSWERPDVTFATEVVATVSKGDAPNFDMPRGTRTEIFDLARDHSPNVELPVVDIASAFAEQSRGWSSGLFPTRSKPSAEQSERTATAPLEVAEPALSGSPSAFPFKSNPQDRDLFVRRIGTERP